jgi:hypothetical protein
MSTFQLIRPEGRPRLPLGVPDPEPVSLVEKHRPRVLAEMVGQGAAVWQLSAFLDAPHSTAFLFDGPTGNGKTTAAMCLAAELGAVEYGGLEIIKSGTQDAEAVECALRSLHFRPMTGSGWHVIVVDEADNRSPKADQLWLSALEDLPPKCVIIFTTNHPEKFAQRFIDRCERVTFAADAVALRQDAAELARRIWAAELHRDDVPALEMLPNLVERGQLSFRRLVRGLEPIVRHVRKTGQMPPLVACTSFAPVETPRKTRQDAPGRVAGTRDDGSHVGAGGDPGRRPGDSDEDARDPCVDCSTRFGGRTSSGKIERTKGRCQSCYNRHRREARR